MWAFGGPSGPLERAGGPMRAHSEAGRPPWAFGKFNLERRGASISKFETGRRRPVSKLDKKGLQTLKLFFQSLKKQTKTLNSSGLRDLVFFSKFENIFQILKLFFQSLKKVFQNLIKRISIFEKAHF